MMPLTSLGLWWPDFVANLHRATVLRLNKSRISLIVVTNFTFESWDLCCLCYDIPIFPWIGEALTFEESDSAVSGPNPDISHDVAPCGCPKHPPPPPPPSELPYPATVDNGEKLQYFLVDYYEASTFHKCPHQPLPMMDSPWMRMKVDPDAQPMAHHKAIPVPIHWCDVVKTGLD